MPIPRSALKKSKWRMIGVEDLPTVTKAEFIRLAGERGVFLRPRDVKYIRYSDRCFWFILQGLEDYSEPGCATSWAVVTDNGKMNRCFEFNDELPIDQTPLKNVVPARSKLR